MSQTHSRIWEGMVQVHPLEGSKRRHHRPFVLRHHESHFLVKVGDRQHEKTARKRTKEDATIIAFSTVVSLLSHCTNLLHDDASLYFYCISHVEFRMGTTQLSNIVKQLYPLLQIPKHQNMDEHPNTTPRKQPQSGDDP